MKEILVEKWIIIEIAWSKTFKNIKLLSNT